MKVRFIVCWYNTSYAEYVDRLRCAMLRQGASEVGVIASNCGCSDPMNGVFFDRSCEFFSYPNVGNWRSRYALKRWVLSASREALYSQRAKLYMQRSGDADVLHFHQTLNAYGSLALFKWLKLPCNAARVVTVHELDGFQTDFPEYNRAYNLADRVLVHARSLERELIELGVEPGRIDLIHHGADLQPPSTDARAGIILYGGHNLDPNKGLETMAAAMLLLREQLGERAPRLKMYGYYAGQTLEYGKQVFAQAGLAGQVDWLGRLSLPDMTREFQRSLVCVQPFTGSFAGLAVTLAMANDVPVIGTRFAAIPEHVGEAGIIIPERSPAELAHAIVRVLEDPELRARLTAAGRQRVEAKVSWDAVARSTLDIYRRAMANRAARAA